MKKHHRLVSLASALLLALAALPCTAMAAEAGDTEPAQGAPPPAALYPAEVRTSEENGMIRLEKVYYLSTRDDPAAIPTGDFDREGRHYTLLDVLKNDLSETDSKDYIEVVTLDSSTSPTEEPNDVRLELIQFINQTRKANGVAELPVSEALMTAAQPSRISGTPGITQKRNVRP